MSASRDFTGCLCLLMAALRLSIVFVVCPPPAGSRCTASFAPVRVRQTLELLRGACLDAPALRAHLRPFGASVRDVRGTDRRVQ